MRTTLDIDADILKAVKALADAERKTMGQVLSELVRRGLRAADTVAWPEGQVAYDPGRSASSGAGQVAPKAPSEVSHADDTRHRR
jgi:hypothetical protein